MQLTKEYLASRYDYDPRNEIFIYKEHPNKRVSWNNQYKGKGVKPLISSGVKYITVNNAIYPLNQLIKLWEEGSNERLNAISIEELSKKEAKRKALISSMSISDLKLLQSQILNNERYTIGNRKAKKASPKSNAQKVVIRASDLLDEEDIKVNDFTGLPRHIYFDGLSNSYYVKIIYKNRKILHFDLITLNEALKVRNQSYKEVIESEES